MATSTFDRPLVISSVESYNKLMDIIDSPAPAPLATGRDINAEMRRGEELLEKCFLRSQKLKKS